METWAWDEICGEWNQIVGRTKREIGKAEITDPTSTEPDGFLYQGQQGRVHVYRDDRGHLAIEIDVENGNEEDVTAIAMADCPEYAKFYEEEI